MENEKDIVVVTGASYGIGKATAKMLAENGYHVVAIARDSDQLETIKNEDIEVHTVDITNVDQVYGFCQKLVGRNVVALVNNAGGGFNLPNSILDDDIQNWNKSFDLNVVGAANLTKQIAPIMIKNGGGNVVLLHQWLDILYIVEEVAIR